MAICNKSEVVAEIGWIQDVVAIMLRDNVDGYDEETDVILAVEGVHKVTDAPSSSKSCIEMKDDLDFYVGTVVQKHPGERVVLLRLLALVRRGGLLMK